MLYCKECQPLVSTLDESDYYFSSALCVKCKTRYETKDQETDIEEILTKNVFTDFQEIQRKVMVSGTKYKIIYADCPWEYKDNNCNGGTKTHYGTMSLDEIMNLPVDSISDDNSILFIWGTWALLPECLKVIESWGFQYKSKAFVWIKTNNNGYDLGTGRWCRANSEFCLLATKGKPQRKSARVSELIRAPKTKHSRKPDEARKKIIQLMGDLPKIELFARTKIHGWDTFGNDEKLKLEPLEAFL